MDDRPRPLPRPLVECPWCSALIELDGTTHLRCRACWLVLELTEPRTARRPPRRLAA